MPVTARAHPIQGLIKYHGLRDPRLRLPYHGSISVCTAPLTSTTTVEVQAEASGDEYLLDGQLASPGQAERIRVIADRVRELAGRHERIRLVSINDFPMNVGLGASASGFAAAAAAITWAFDLDLETGPLSAVARLGAGSAARAVAGGFAEWHAGSGDTTSIAECLVGPDELQMDIVIAQIPVYKETEDAHREAVASPHFPARVQGIPARLQDLRAALAERDLPRIASIAERDTLDLHAITMTGPAGRVFWTPETLWVIHSVRALRDAGTRCWFSIDTGATVYVNCPPGEGDEVEQILAEHGLTTLRCTVGGGVVRSSDHLDL